MVLINTLISYVFVAPPVKLDERLVCRARFTIKFFANTDCYIKIASSILPSTDIILPILSRCLIRLRRRLIRQGVFL